MINYQGLSDALNLTLLCLSLLCAWWVCLQRRSVAGQINHWITSFAARPRLSVGVLLGISLIVNFGLTLVRYPIPRVHDEFSYLLAADTYASGRLTNPTHPHWKHFETYHVLSQPSYMSKYPPGNGLFLALGQVTTGHPIVGSWTALALGIAATYWALLAWVDRRWALIGSSLLAINVPMLMAWGQTYWGGGVQLIGGSLVLGAMRRIIDRDCWPRSVWQYACVFACGSVVLANSRPLEGVFVCAIASLALLFWLWRSEPTRRLNRLTQLAIPCLLIGIAGIVSLTINNKAVTGRASQLPYSTHSQQYSSTSLVIWSALPPLPKYNLSEMKVFYRDWVRQRQIDARTPAGYFSLIVEKVGFLRQFFTFLGGVCLLPLLYLVRRDRWLQFAVAGVAGLLLIEFQLVHSRTFPHYVAPVSVLFYVAMFQSLRWLHAVGRKDRLARLVLPTVVIYSMTSLIAYGIGSAIRPEYENRVCVERQLGTLPGKHLVMVEYSKMHNVHAQWVYNRADIDNARIVWAHRLSPSQEAELMQYFNDRTIWIWKADEGIHGLSPFAGFPSSSKAYDVAASR